MADENDDAAITAVVASSATTAVIVPHFDKSFSLCSRLCESNSTSTPVWTHHHVVIS